MSMATLTRAVARACPVSRYSRGNMSVIGAPCAKLLGPSTVRAQGVASDSALEPFVVDVSAKDADTRVVEALQARGFFYATGHGIPEDLMDRSRGLAKSFHAMPRSAKEACVSNPGTIPLGYRDQRKISLDPESQSRPDTRESFLFSAAGSEHSSWYTVDEEIASGRLPCDFKVALTDYWNQVQCLSKHVLRLTCGALQVEKDFFDSAGVFDQSMSLMSLLRYDETVSQVGKGIVGCGAHCDFGAITVLQQDPEVEGLQIALDKHAPLEEMEWRPIPPRRGTFVVSCGLALENWSNGRFSANLHRVVSSGGRERISVPFFLQPNANCRVAPLQKGEEPLFEPIFFGEYLQSRFEATGRNNGRA